MDYVQKTGEKDPHDSQNEIGEQRVDEFVSLAEGTHLSGLYIGTFKTDYGPVYKLQASDGVILGLNGGRVRLDRRMEKVAVGSQVTISRGEDEPHPKEKGKTISTYRVSVSVPPEGIKDDDIPF